MGLKKSETDTKDGTVKRGPAKDVKNKAPREKKRVVVEINVNDVIFGRGNTVSKLQGNSQFRCLIWEYKRLYNQAANHEKAEIAQRVMDVIASCKPPGRFLESTSNGAFFVVSKARAVEKCCQALRERKNTAPPMDMRKKVAKRLGIPLNMVEKRDKTDFKNNPGHKKTVAIVPNPTKTGMTLPIKKASLKREHSGSTNPTHESETNESVTTLDLSTSDQASVPRTVASPLKSAGHPTAKKAPSQRAKSVQENEIDGLGTNDVRFGRGFRFQSHLGNVRFLQFLYKFKVMYEAAPTNEKRAIATRIVEKYDGRFVESKGGSLHLLPLERCLEKIEQIMSNDDYWDIRAVNKGKNSTRPIKRHEGAMAPGGKQANASLPSKFDEEQRTQVLQENQKQDLRMETSAQPIASESFQEASSDSNPLRQWTRPGALVQIMRTGKVKRTVARRNLFAGLVAKGSTCERSSEIPATPKEGRAGNGNSTLDHNTAEADYLANVKECFQHQPEVMETLLSIIKDVKSGIDLDIVKHRIAILFLGHERFISGFNVFLPTCSSISSADADISSNNQELKVDKDSTQLLQTSVTSSVGGMNDLIASLKVGSRIAVYWDLDNEYYEAVVEEIQQEPLSSDSGSVSRVHHIRYVMDNVREPINLENECWKPITQSSPGTERRANPQGGEGSKGKPKRPSVWRSSEKGSAIVF